MTSLLNSNLLVPYLLFAGRRLLTFLHIFQQEEYDPARFVHWLWQRRAFDRRASIGLFLSGIVAVAVPQARAYALSAAGLTLLVVVVLEADPRKAAKKKLVMTGRAKRLFAVALALLGVLAVFGVWLQLPALGWIGLAQIVPLSLVLAVLLCAPYERRANRRFIAQAHDRLLSLRPTVIGITGSFGKTSVKHILGHLLAIQAPTLVTPGSVNTELGITRIVREKLTQRDRYFVCEMGAYGIGSIARLCRLAPPDIGIITAIGPAHYERFKSLDNVVQAKFELASAVIDRQGTMIVHQSVLAFTHAASFAARHRSQMVIVGDAETADVRIVDSGQTSAGVFVALQWRGEHHRLQAKLYGTHHAANLAMAFAAAAVLGVAPADIVVAVGSTPQVKHRSEVKPHPSGAVLIDDAYNSNPSGFAGALPLLDLLRDQGRRILVTPGMVELGTAHDAEHARIGRLAADHVDILLPVLPERLAPMIEAFEQHAPAGIVVPQSGMQSALAWMESNLKPGDAVLLENDLPDLYESRLTI